jgi:hypothetical protein
MNFALCMRLFLALGILGGVMTLGDQARAEDMTEDIRSNRIGPAVRAQKVSSETKPAKVKAVAETKRRADMPVVTGQGRKQRRVALVIGHDRYATLPGPLNAGADARGMAEKLRGLGFEVIVKIDAGRRTFHRAIREFRGKLRGADVGLVFYAGHGIQVEGENYLIPADAQIEMEDDLRIDGIRAAEFLLAMKTAGGRQLGADFRHFGGEVFLKPSSTSSFCA